jgi:hypothetical protein
LALYHPTLESSDASLKDGAATHAWVLLSGEVDDYFIPCIQSTAAATFTTNMTTINQSNIKVSLAGFIDERIYLHIVA